LQAIKQLFKENRLAKDKFVGLGRELDLRNITCPVYLLAGAADDTTTRSMYSMLPNISIRPKSRIPRETVPGGHIGLFMGTKTLQECWPEIAGWIVSK
jgi:poly(3-hydroxybutyrate) depolymerase